MSSNEISKAFQHRPFQRVGALFALKHRNVLIADDPGLGKTLQSIAASVGLAKVQGDCNESILVVAPKTAVYVTWPAELKRWLPDGDVVRSIGGELKPHQRRQVLLEAMNHQGGRQWILVSPNYLRFNVKTDEDGNYIYSHGKKIITPVREALTEFLDIEWSAVIVDEAHETLAGATGNIKHQSAQRRGLGLLKIKDGGLRIALSGTPSRGKPENLWGILNWLEPKTYTSYWKWVKKHFHLYSDIYSDHHIGELKSEAALAQELSHLMIRRTKGEVAKELPPKMYGGTPLWSSAKGDKGPVAVWLNMSGKQRRAYEDIARAAMTELEGGTLMANGILAEMIRLKQFANSFGYIDDSETFRPSLPSNKFDWLLEFLRERGIDNGPPATKVVVASQFTKHVNLFANELDRTHGIRSFVLTGATSARERIRIQREFQNDCGVGVFLLNTRAGGISLTLDAADEMVLIDSTFNPDDQIQVEDRIHRISRQHNVTIWNLCSANTIDESIAKHCYKMETSIHKVLDGERGIAFAKLLIGDSL